LLPDDDILGILALLLLRRRLDCDQLLVLLAYDHAVQYVRQWLSLDVLVRVCEISGFSQLAPYSPEVLAASVLKALDVRTIRSSRGSTADSVFVVLSRRRETDRQLRGQLFDDPGLRRVAFSRARGLLVALVSDDILDVTNSGHREMPGFGGLRKCWPSVTFTEDGGIGAKEAALDHPERTLDKVVVVSVAVVVWNWVCSVLRELFDKTRTRTPARGRPVDDRSSIAASFADANARRVHAEKMLAALDRRRDARAQPEQAEQRAQEAVENFNSRGTGGSAASSSYDASAEPQRWLSQALRYAVPAIHWHLSAEGDRDVDVENPRSFPHLVAMPFFQKYLPTEGAPHQWDEHLQLAKMFCPPGHRVEVLRHKGHTVHTEHAVHYWKECNSERYAVAVLRERAPPAPGQLPQSGSPVRLYAYHGMGTKRMLSCLQGIVLRIADLGMVHFVAEKLGEHWPLYQLDSNDFVIWEQTAAASDRTFEGVQQAWETGCSRRRGHADVRVAAGAHVGGAP